MKKRTTLTLLSSLSFAAFSATSCAQSSSEPGRTSTSSGGTESSDNAPTIDNIDAPVGMGGDGVVCNSLGDDLDEDGFTTSEGDCNDCNPDANPGAIDVPGNGFDEDCNGIPDDAIETCDAPLAIDSSDPYDAAAALGLCRVVEGDAKNWGLLEAKWVYPDGAPANVDKAASGRALLQFYGGIEAQEGTRLLSMSTGSALDNPPNDSIRHTQAGDPDPDTGGVASGFPMNSSRCEKLQYESPPDDPTWDSELLEVAHDPVALELKIRVPSNARSLAYDFNFFTTEFPDYICTRFNDFFVALMDPAPAGALNGNISFDAAGQPVSVNNGLLQICTAGTSNVIGSLPEQTAEEYDCPLGPDLLNGTGLEGHAATGWLSSEVPVSGGDVVTIRFAIWDSFDHQLDSTVLLDNFRFSAAEAETSTQPVVR